ncbi:hypothetical protein [Pseudoalteromonas luteoviolacea]|uniref:Uncharacterized protein n=1 Tax=Pseudoalteromonas luteoviolacea S4054 TaxID=1129367 RepID=A0A0F6ABP8_9GAMM|nr:hypothetical protein [Pseudoalteromonas luteoviolacea]AOT09007.1 hypothetical protein S4054249_14555 [Pseudoalteromonas luteoviolacea]AOT13919.1 hypothetical protein S40542_14525 [Pseudoalteromonas luteoviolacea]AOT18834.1 hypothetical protein S4054_14530 [Pseudoalteromonas luteoviolacea]KKE83642.1 hypothetical protein N479_01030 [Pseudoalteromonas luteoviolacea S4054]KZN63419.1 hypothetical protein N481_25645 [Pseudoalteromonas luteoviolacea S4047-1]
MKFEQLLSHLDSGVCVEQLQKESLLDIALMSQCVCGEIRPSELSHVLQWANSLQWNASISLNDYIDESISKCLLALKSNRLQSFIDQRMQQIEDAPLKDTAQFLINKINTANREKAEANI